MGCGASSGSTVVVEAPPLPAKDAEDAITNGGTNGHATNGAHAAPAVDTVQLSTPTKEEGVTCTKFHSAVRWGKPVDELQALLESDESLAGSVDEKNGNQPLHIACQNGHIAINKWLISDKKVDVNAQNKKGQTPLHMSVEYDFMNQTQFLLDNGANGEIENGDGNKAITGIDGGKTGAEAWNSPINMLRNATDGATMNAAFDAIEAADAGIVEKAELAKTGMIIKKVALKECWDAPRFMTLMRKLD